MSRKEIIYSPSLLAGNFANAASSLKEVADAGCDYIHLDVMDGRFVPSITFGPKLIADLRKESDLIFDVHLMITEPVRYIDRFATENTEFITVHFIFCIICKKYHILWGKRLENKHILKEASVSRTPFSLKFYKKTVILSSGKEVI